MRVTRIKLQNYRNIAFADLKLDGCAQFLAGPNAQGKTNLLESVGLLTALRSFRARDGKTLIRHDCREAKLAFYLADERFDLTEVWITLKRRGKEVVVDGKKVTRFRDFIGRFPVVVLSGRDIQLLRGSPVVRRQWLNLLLASGNAEYYDDLRDFHRLLYQRNALLKIDGKPAELDVFEKMLAEKAARLHAHRASEMAKLASEMKRIYQIVSPVREDPELHYKPDLEASSPEDYLASFQENRERDHLLKSTQHGPHRDDISFYLESKMARDYASEGQQRSMVISLKLAQLQYLRRVSGVVPVLVADDILEELDNRRKSNFWKAVGESVQVMAAGTAIPSVESPVSWQVFHVIDGKFEERE